jgi:serine/threonine protein kinase
MSNKPFQLMSNTGTSGNFETLQKNYNFLSSTNLLYREQLPPEYSLPTLIPGYSPDLRGINTIDNEEQIPDVDFKEVLSKFEINKDEISNDSQENFAIKDEKLRKTYSENEMSKYDWQSGRRKSVYASEKNLIYDWEPDYNHESSKREYLEKEKICDGIADEYIPNFVCFDLDKFGIEDNVVSDDFDKDEELLHRKRSLVSEDSSISIPKSRPIEIKPNKNKKNLNANDEIKVEKGDFFTVSNESFKIADSPEREGDRLILSSLPKGFQSLSFSYRRQMLTDLLPDYLKNDSDYKNHITKILRKNSASTSTLSSISPMFRCGAKRQRGPDPNSNELGSILLHKWKLGRVINNGSFGIIRECFNVDDAEEVKAVKIISIKKNLKNLRKCQSEIFMWSKLQHETIISLLDLKITANHIFLLMPLYDEGSLFDRVKYWESKDIKIHERFDCVMSYIRTILDSLLFLHHKGIHHGDIKLENFLLEKNVPKLCDFGMTNFDLDAYNNLPAPKEINEKINNELKFAISLLSPTKHAVKSLESPTSMVLGPMSSVDEKPKSCSKSVDTMPRSQIEDIHNNEVEHEHEINIGSLPYAAPELLQPSPVSVDRQTDIWAFGVLLYSLVVLKLPFWHIYEPRLKLKIIEGDWESDEWKNKLVELPKLQTVNKLIKGCLVDRRKRFIVDDLFEIFTKT